MAAVAAAFADPVGPVDGCCGAGTGAVVAGLKGGVGSASAGAAGRHHDRGPGGGQRHRFAGRSADRRVARRPAAAAGRRRRPRAAVRCRTGRAAPGCDPPSPAAGCAARRGPGRPRTRRPCRTPPSASSPPTPRCPRPSAPNSPGSATTASPDRSSRSMRCSTATPSSAFPPPPRPAPDPFAYHDILCAAPTVVAQGGGPGGAGRALGDHARRILARLPGSGAGRPEAVVTFAAVVPPSLTWPAGLPSATRGCRWGLHARWSFPTTASVVASAPVGSAALATGRRGPRARGARPDGPAVHRGPAGGAGGDHRTDRGLSAKRSSSCWCWRPASHGWTAR